LWVDFPTDEDTFGEQDSHLVGSDLLIAPVLTPGTNTKSVYFPGTEPWYDVQTSEV